jgi:hypothetical protein
MIDAIRETENSSAGSADPIRDGSSAMDPRVGTPQSGVFFRTR